MNHCFVNHHITCFLVFVLVSTEWIMMCPAIDNPASYEIRIICFLCSINRNAAEIHCELSAVYGQNVMREGTVRQWCRMFKDWRANKCSRWRAKFPSICSEWWSCSKCWPKNLRKTTFHTFRTFVWISTKFHALFPASFSWSGWAITIFAQDGFRKCSRLRIKSREWLGLLRFRAIPQKRWQFFQSHGERW
jgi:hypothetical protein